jgi:hypothetical protein
MDEEIAGLMNGEVAGLMDGEIAGLMSEAFGDGDIDGLDALVRDHGEEFYSILFHSWDDGSASLYARFLERLFNSDKMKHGYTILDVLHWLDRYMESVDRAFDVDAFNIFEGGDRVDEYVDDYGHVRFTLPLLLLMGKHSVQDTLDVLDWIEAKFEAVGDSLDMPFIQFAFDDVDIVKWALNRGWEIDFDDNPRDVGVLFALGNVETLDLLYEHDPETMNSLIRGIEPWLMRVAVAEVSWLRYIKGRCVLQVTRIRL